MSALSEENKLYLARLESLWQESRDEIKQRITQRDNYFIRMSITFAAIIVGTIKYKFIVFLLPIVALYFAVLLTSSYKIHDALSSYMCNELEAKIKTILIGCGNSTYQEYEEMFNSIKLVGVRSWLTDYLVYLISTVSIVIAIVIGPPITEMFSWQNEMLFIIASSVFSVITWLIFLSKN